MNKMIAILSLYTTFSMACPGDHVKQKDPKFVVGDCLADSPEDEFQIPEKLKVLAVGKKRYQYKRYDQGGKHWGDTKEDSSIGLLTQYL